MYALWRKGFATMRYTISGIPNAMRRYPYTYCVGSRTTLAACYNCRTSSVCRVPLSPKWATPGLGSDFAISPYVVVCNPSITLYLFDPCDSDTDAVITNPHTSKCTEHNCPANTADPINTVERAPPRGRRPAFCCSTRSLRMPPTTYANLMRCGC